MKYRVVSFDLDRTLTKGDTVHLALARKAGKYKEVEEIEREHYSGKLPAEEATEIIIKHLKGLTENDLDEVFREISKVKDVRKTVEALKADGFRVILISGTLRQFTERFMEYGFEWSTGYLGEFVNGVFTGNQVESFSSKDKALRLKEFCEKTGIPIEQSIAVGDSMNDRWIFEAAGLAIGFNPTNDISDLVNYTVNSDSLWDVYEIIKK